MKKLIVFLVILSGVSSSLYGQVYKAIYAKPLVLGIGTSPTSGITLQAPAAITAYSLTLPTTAPTEVGQVLGVLTSGSSSTLEWTGSPRGMVASKTAAYTAVASDRFIFVSNTGATYSITLPTAANKGQLITVTKTDANANNISVVAAAGQTLVQIGARATLTGQAHSVTLAADGTTTWYVVAHEAPDAAAASVN